MVFTVGADMLLGGRYRLLERIAVGGQGEVWRAVDTALDRDAAVKVLHGEHAGSAEFRDRFRREARHAAALSHPRVAQVFDYDEGDGDTPPYLVMEYVDGEPLSAAIARDAPLGADRVLDVIASAASALAAAHAAGLVHRDVKPANLLLTRDGSVKITDFGIAHAADATPLTQTGALLGTPQYLSPEQASGMGATSATDLYALGVIAYEMLSGRRPYEGPAGAVLLAHRDSPLPPLPSSVPPGLADLVHALTAKDPAARPDSAAAVVDWASRLRADPAYRGPAGPAGALASPPPVRRHRRRPALLLAGIAIALAAGLVGWLMRPGSSDPAVQRKVPVVSPAPTTPPTTVRPGPVSRAPTPPTTPTTTRLPGERAVPVVPPSTPTTQPPSDPSESVTPSSPTPTETQSETDGPGGGGGHGGEGH
jgi:eukaryotic-like serine/threonine-protein kinase